jgi:hypothetical protein
LTGQHNATDSVAHRILDLERERDYLQSLIEGLATRVAAQAEMLGRSAERRGETAERVKELERALAPFAAILANGWDDGSLPATARYPVRMGDLRWAARALAGTQDKETR